MHKFNIYEDIGVKTRLLFVQNGEKIEFSGYVSAYDTEKYGNETLQGKELMKRVRDKLTERLEADNTVIKIENGSHHADIERS